MRFSMRQAALAGVLAIGFLAFGTAPAKAQGYGGGGFYGGGYGQGYGGGGYGQGYGGGGYGQGYGGGGYGQGYGGGYGVPTYNYYGNGGHDFAPHMHNVQTPFGGYSYYGLGAHDFRPHMHSETPYGITGYNGGYYSNTQSFSPPSPYVFRRW